MFTVTATNAAGEGVASSTLTVSTPAAPAAATSAPIAISVDDDSVVLSYQVALTNGLDTNGNAATGYKLYAQSRKSSTDPWQAAARSVENDGEDSGWAADPDDVNYVNRDRSNRGLAASDPDWLEITMRDDDAFGSTNTVTVNHLEGHTDYRFKIAFINAAGLGAESPVSGTFRTLESPVTALRMFSGPPCVYQTPADTTFAASAAGSNIKYRWEMVYKEGAGMAALNEDSSAAATCTDPDGGTTCNAHNADSATCIAQNDASGNTCVFKLPGANDFDAGVDGNIGLHAGRTKHVMAGSVIAMPGSANCLNTECSVMNYRLPLPGFDEAVANYDEIEIRVVAYNTRGQVRESTVFGWTATDVHDYQTIEYCGCTDPLDDAYWDLATYNVPTECSGVEDWSDTGAAYSELSTVLKDEYEYYQFQVTESMFDVQVSLRIDDGAVDLFVSADGVANPDLDSTHIPSLQQTGVTGSAMINIDYRHLAGSKSIYVTVRGSSGVADPFCVGSTAACTGATHGFGRYVLMAQASSFRSYSCVASGANNADGTMDCSAASPEYISRQILQNEVALSSVLPSHYYDFYEYYYPQADADLDIEITVQVDAVATPAGAVQVYASKTERYPGPQRATDSYDGYWTGASHTCVAKAADADAKKLYFTMKPSDHYDDLDGDRIVETPEVERNVLYLSVFGAVAHAQGTELPSTKYSITAKVYRYRVESDLLEAITAGGPLTEDRRYSVVTQDNFNYYEVPLTTKTSSVTVVITVNYGEIDVYRSKSKLPTQDVSNAGNDLVPRTGTCTDPDGGTTCNAHNANSATCIAQNDASGDPCVFTGGWQAVGGFEIAASDLNIVGGYVYLGLIGRVPDSSYNIEVTLNELSASDPTELFYCPGLATNVGTTSACDTVLSSVAIPSFYKLYIGTKDVDKYVTERSGPGAAPTDLSTSADTWGTDWTENLVSTWSDSFSDEWDTDVSLSVTSAYSGGAAYNIIGSATEHFPSADRAYCLDGSAADRTTCEGQGSTWSVVSAEDDGVNDDELKMTVHTFGGKWLYVGFTSPTATSLAGDVTIAFTNQGVAPTSASSDDAYTPPSCSALANCNGNGACVVDGDNAFCVCNTGYYGAECATASGLDLPAAGTDPSASISVAGCSTAVLEAGACVLDELDAATESITLDCATGIDDCTPRGAAGVVGTVTCADDGVTCTQLMPTPMATVTATIANAPAYGRLHAYVDGQPYPRAGAHVFTIATEGSATKTIKVYSLAPRVKHTVMLVLTTDAGESIATAQQSFGVKYMDGSGCTKAAGPQAVGAAIDHTAAQTVTLAVADATIVAGATLQLNDADGQTCAAAPKGADLVVDSVSGAVITFAAGSLTGSDASAAVNCVITRTDPGPECSANGVCYSGYCVCFDGFWGTHCETSVADETVTIDTTGFDASKAFRDRRTALTLDKVGKTKFVSAFQLDETSTELARAKTSLDAIKSAVNTKLQSEIYAEDDPATTGTDEGSALHKEIKQRKDATDAAVLKLRAKQERDTIKIQQARQESARLTTSNREAYLDHKRALFAHQTEVQNRHAASKLDVKAKMDNQNAAISDAFTEGRFIKNQLRTANGPTTKISDLKTQSCTTDQFLHTTCSDVDYADGDFDSSAGYGDVPR